MSSAAMIGGRNGMFDDKQHDFCAEFYSVEKSIEVVVQIRGEDTRIRIEALRDESTGRYSARAYVEERVTLQPTYPQTGDSYDRPPEDFDVWVHYDLPGDYRGSADAILECALGVLKESSSS
jgi:hypothetical protein